MLTVRPIRPGDETGFAALHGSCDEARAGALVAASQAAFAGAGTTAQRHVFVLHDSDAGAGGGLLGAAAMAGRTGLDWPRYSFRRGLVVHASAELKMFNVAETLVLSNDHTGCAELSMPAMASADSKVAPQRLLIDAMLLYVASHSDRFASTLIADLPGLRSADGDAPFWRGLGRHFHGGAVPRVDAFFPTPERSHIGRLMPKHPLYSSFIGGDAQGCIGQRALAGRDMADALHAQGFRYRGHVDIVDAGPIVEVDVPDLVAVRQSRMARVGAGAADRGRPALVTVDDDAGFRCGLVAGALVAETWMMAADAMRVLGVDAGARVRVLRQSASALDLD